MEWVHYRQQVSGNNLNQISFQLDENVGSIYQNETPKDVQMNKEDDKVSWHIDQVLQDINNLGKLHQWVIQHINYEPGKVIFDVNEYKTPPKD